MSKLPLGKDDWIIMPTEKAHQIQCRKVSPGETLEAFGVSPDEVIGYEPASYEGEDGYGRKYEEELLRVWYIQERQVEVGDCRNCGSEKVYSKSKGHYVCPHCDIDDN